MASNYLGRNLRLSTFGESHGAAIGGVLDGLPAGIKINIDHLNSALEKRRPGQSSLSTPRKEQDAFELLSGLFEGITTGAPLAWIIRNKDVRSTDYENLKNVLRPSHADATYLKKYGIRDHRGGGRSSARETANWVMAGAIAQFIIPEVYCKAFVDQIGHIRLENPWDSVNLNNIESNPVRCPDAETAVKMAELIEQARDEGDSLGGAIRCVIQNVPPGLGSPVFGKLQARLAEALFSLNAVKGLEFGAGFSAAAMRGSQHNDGWLNDNEMASNHAGGILGGISNGEPIYFRLAFKPTATISKFQLAKTVDGELIELKAQGRHDPCVLPRAVPIVEALSLFVLADLTLDARKDQL